MEEEEDDEPTTADNVPPDHAREDIHDNAKVKRLRTMQRVLYILPDAVVKDGVASTNVESLEALKEFVVKTFDNFNDVHVIEYNLKANNIREALPKNLIPPADDELPFLYVHGFGVNFMNELQRRISFENVFVYSPYPAKWMMKYKYASEKDKEVLNFRILPSDIEMMPFYVGELDIVYIKYYVDFLLANDPESPIPLGTILSHNHHAGFPCGTDVATTASEKTKKMIRFIVDRLNDLDHVYCPDNDDDDAAGEGDEMS